MSAVYKGIFPALQCPFDDKLAIDEAELRKFASWLASHKGIGGLVTNGHTGEVFALTGKQRAEVTRIVADEVKGKLPVVSGLCCEGIAEAVEHAKMARDAGATGLLVMPPHMWLRFGMKQPENVVDYFTAIGEGLRPRPRGPHLSRLDARLLQFRDACRRSPSCRGSSA